MIGIDANILLRFVTRDDEAQAKRAAQILTERCSEENPGYVTSIALVELVWTLLRVYKYERSDVAKALEALSNAREILFEYPDETRYAIRYYSEGTADFADALMGLICESHECETTLTFDGKASKLSFFEKA